MNRSLALVAYCAISVFLLAGCQKEKETAACKPGFTNLAPTKAHSYEVNAGQITRFHAEPRACRESTNYSVRWRLNNEIVSYSNDYDFIACNEDAGVHELYAEAITYASTDTASVEQVVAAHKWAINVIDVSKPATPACYAQSIRDIQNTKASGNAEDAQRLQAAVSCLEPYLKTYACDFKASYATGLAKAALFAETLYPFYLARADKTVEDVKVMVEQQINPIRQHFFVVAEKAPEDFSFTVDGIFKVVAFQDDPNLRGDDMIYFEGYGRHDKTEAAALTTMMNFFDAFLSIGMANQGIVDFVMHTPDNETPTTGAERLISLMEKDPRFLTFIDGFDANGAPLNDGSGAEGRRLMGLAQNSLINGFKDSSALFTRIMAETHDQANDPIRYWDCGKDAICPATCPYMGAVKFNHWGADLPEYRNHGSCDNAGDSFDDDNYNNKCDEGWTKADAGECNGQYDDGEQIGTTRVAFGSGPTKRVSPQVTISILQAIFQIMRDNIRGPDHLDLDKIAEIAGFGTGNFVTLGLQGLLLPYPMIRLSEFFVTPTQFRDLVPLYDKKAKQFIISLESEPFDDTGYDGLFSYEETGYDRQTNPDPNRDDLDIYCNPFCNENDVIPFDPSDPFVGTPVDNDGDGKPNGADDGFIEDMGVEGNLTFDFIDRQPFNKKHDLGEVSEPFKDIGTVNARGATVGAGNKVWDKADRAHTPPTGSNIGPVSNISLPEDPANGLLLEQPDGLYDFYYYFFQDPTFSGVVKMVADPRKPAEKITNADGIELTDNALIHRFMNRGLQLADEVKIWEANAHPCSLADYSKCNHWPKDKVGYQP